MNRGKRELKRLASSINYDLKVKVIAEAELMGGVFRFIMKPKLLS